MLLFSVENFAQHKKLSIILKNANEANSTNKSKDSLYIDLDNDTIWLSHSRNTIIDSFPEKQIREDSFQISYYSIPPYKLGPLKIKQKSNHLQYFVLGENRWRKGGVISLRMGVSNPTAYLFSSPVLPTDIGYFSTYVGDSTLLIAGKSYECYIIRQYTSTEAEIKSKAWMMPDVILYISKKYLVPFKIIAGTGISRIVYDPISISFARLPKS
jgi:hypothetical protein